MIDLTLIYPNRKTTFPRTYPLTHLVPNNGYECAGFMGAVGYEKAILGKIVLATIPDQS